MDSNTDKLLTMKEVRERLGNIHENTLYRYIKDGLIPIVRISRTKRFITQESLEKFIKEHTGIYKS